MAESAIRYTAGDRNGSTIDAVLVEQLAKLDLLILDELGYVPASKAGAELLFDVIATTYERNSVIVTTNLPFEMSPCRRKCCLKPPEGLLASSLLAAARLLVTRATRKMKEKVQRMASRCFAKCTSYSSDE